MLRDGAGNSIFPAGQYKTYEDTSFIAGESPRTLDFNTDLGHNANNGYIINDGTGNLTLSISQDGSD